MEVRLALCLVETSLKWSLQLSDRDGKRSGREAKTSTQGSKKIGLPSKEYGGGEWEGIRPELEPHTAVSPSDLQENAASIRASL